MLRGLTYELLLILLPPLLYVLWLLLRRRRVSDAANWTPRTILTLAILSLAVTFAGLAVFGHLTRAPIDAIYVPAHTDADGKFVPGGFR